MDQEGTVLAEGSIETSRQGLVELCRRLRLEKGTSVGLESGTQAFWAARVVFELELEPVVINAQEVRAKAQRRNQKSDNRDAYEICDGLRRGIYQSRVYVPTPQIQKLRQILSRRRHFVKVATMQINAVKFLLRSAALKVACSLTSWAGWEKLLANEQAFEFRQHIRMHAEMWKMAQQNIERLEKELEDACRPFEEEMKLLQTVPGVGLITAATFLAVVGEPDRTGAG